MFAIFAFIPVHYFLNQIRPTFVIISSLAGPAVLLTLIEKIIYGESGETYSLRICRKRLSANALLFQKDLTLRPVWERYFVDTWKSLLTSYFKEGFTENAKFYPLIHLEVFISKFTFSGSFSGIL